MAKNSFKRKNFEDFEIVDKDGGTLGHVRLKPNAIFWAPRSAKGWYGIDLEKFGKFAEEEGTRKLK